MSGNTLDVSEGSWRTDVLALVLGVAAFAPSVRVNIFGEDPQFYALEAVGAAFFLWAAVRFTRRQSSPVPWTTWTTALLWAVLVGASMAGKEPLVSLGIARVTVLATGIAWALVSWPGRIDRIRFLALGIAGGVVMHSIVIGVRVYGLSEGVLAITSEIRREIVILGGSLNSASSLLLVALPFLIVGVSHVASKLRPLVFAAIALATWGIWLSESRALVYASLVLLIAWLVAVALPSTRAPWRTEVAIGIMLLVGFGFATTSADSVVVGGVVAGWERMGTVVESILPPGGSAQEGANTGPDGGQDAAGDEDPDIEPEDNTVRDTVSDKWRRAFFEAAWLDFTNRPILGSGFRLRSTPYGVSGFAHNAVLEILAAAGLLGAVASGLVILAYAYRWVAEGTRNSRIKIVATGGLLAGAVVALVQPFLNTSHLFAALWWLLLAVPLLYGQDEK